MKKPAADFSARALEDCCDDGVMPVICPTCQMLISLFPNYSRQAGEIPARAIDVVIARPRKPCAGTFALTRRCTNPSAQISYRLIGPGAVETAVRV